MNARSVFHFLNLLPVLLFIPFAITVMGPEYGFLTTSCFVISVLSLTFFNHFLIVYLKRKAIINSWWLVGFVGVAGTLIALEYSHIFSVKELSASLFVALLKNPVFTIVFVAFFICSFVNNSIFLRNNLYFEEMAGKGRQRQSTEYVWLQQWGLAGELIGMNLRLVLRNKRAKSMVITSSLILLYGFIFYNQESLKPSHSHMLLLGALFITGIFIMSFGQFLFAWHSSYFDGLMSLPVSIPTFIRSQFLMFIAVGTISFVITSPYALISWKVLAFQFAAYLYNIGINAVVVVYFATRSYKAIDLTKGASFNYQGTGMSQWLNVIAVMLVPLFLYLGLEYFFNEWMAIITVGVLGLISLLLQNWWIGILSRQFLLRKYLILAGFREK